VFEALFVAAAITVTDPAGDVVGAESLQPPTAAVYRNLAPFDLRQVSLVDGSPLTLEIEMGSLANTVELPLGFSLPVIEVYIEGRDEGQAELLGGSGMRLPDGRRWEVALRLTGEQARVHRAGASGVETAVPEVQIDGNRLLVTTPFERPERPRVYAMTGLYDLFGASPWRPVDENESPWAFSSASQRVPVVDVLARDATAQRQAVASQTLPPSGGRRGVRGAAWLLLMAVGLLVALLGVAIRAFSRDRAPSRDLAPVHAAPGSGGEPPDKRGGAGEEVTAGTPEGRDSAAGDEFTWDSSALLTEAQDEEYSEEFARSESSSRTEVWSRPVPLPVEKQAAPEDDADEENAPEMIRDEEREEDDREPRRGGKRERD
jgi:hypothetical protein